jgi:hypothetical protein
MGITEQQAADILANNAKVSANGTINTHSDVEYQWNVSNGHILTWDGSSWTNTEESSTVQERVDILANNAKVSADGPVSTHSDVNILIPGIGDILVWSGSDWINIPYTAGLSAQQVADIVESNAKVSADGTINWHNDVQVNPISTSEVIYYDGFEWSSIDEFILRRQFHGGLVTNFGNNNVPADLSSSNDQANVNAWTDRLEDALNMFPDGRGGVANLCFLDPALLRWQVGLATGLFAPGNETIMFRNRGSAFGIYGVPSLYDATIPFENVNSPTIEELKDWNVVVINHFRRILGNPIPITRNARLDMEALWSSERTNTTLFGSPVHADSSFQFIPNQANQEQSYGTEWSATAYNTFPHGRFTIDFTNIEAGAYKSQIWVHESLSWAKHMEAILLFWTGYRGIDNGLTPVNFTKLLVEAFYGRSEIGMCIFKGSPAWSVNPSVIGGVTTPASERIFYRFTFGGQHTDRCLVPS